MVIFNPQTGDLRGLNDWRGNPLGTTDPKRLRRRVHFCKKTRNDRGASTPAADLELHFRIVLRRLFAVQYGSRSIGVVDLQIFIGNLWSQLWGPHFYHFFNLYSRYNMVVVTVWFWAPNRHSIDSNPDPSDDKFNRLPPGRFTNDKFTILSIIHRRFAIFFNFYRSDHKKLLKLSTDT